MPPNDPFDSLEPVRAVGGAPMDGSDPFEGLEPRGLPPSLRRRQPHDITDAFSNLLYGAAETVAGPVQFGAEMIDRLGQFSSGGRGGSDLAGGFERGVVQPLRERYFASDAPDAPLAEPMREVGRLLPVLPIRRLPGAGALGRTLTSSKIPLLRRPGVQRTIHDTALGAGAGGLSYTPEGSSRQEQAEIGALAGGGIGLAGRSLVGGVVRLRNALSGRFDPKVQGVMDTARRYDVRLSGVDPDPQRFPHSFARAVRAEKQLTPGMATFRREQAGDVNRAARKLQARYEGDFVDDWATSAQQSMTRRATRMRAIVGSKYDDLANLSEGSKIAPSQTLGELDEFIAREQGKILSDKALIKELGALKETLESGPASFERLRDFRSDLGLQLKSHYRGGNAIIGEKGAVLYARLRRAVDKDMESWARGQGGKVEAAWRAADKTYRNFARTYRKKQIAALKDIDDPIQLYDRFKTLAYRQPQSLYNALGPEGRRAIRYGIVRDAIETATRTTPTGEAVSAARLAARLEKMKKSFELTLGAEAREIDGFVKLMRAAERSGQFMEYPPTGMRSIFALGNIARGGSLGVAYMVGGMPLVGGVVGAQALSSLRTRIMFTTKAGQRMMLAASHLDPRGEAMRRMVTERIPQLVATHATVEDVIPWPEVDPSQIPADLREMLHQQPAGVAVKDEQTGLLYALDPSGGVRVIE